MRPTRLIYKTKPFSSCLQRTLGKSFVCYVCLCQILATGSDQTPLGYLLAHPEAEDDAEEEEEK